MHIGKRVQEVMSEKGKTVAWLAEQLPCERSNIYNMFHRRNIGVDLLMRLSELMEHDFFQELSNEFRNQEH